MEGRSVRDLASVISLVAQLRTDQGLVIDVTVEDARFVYGREDYLVTPLAGSGLSWVSAERVKLTGPAKEGR